MDKYECDRGISYGLEHSSSAMLSMISLCASLSDIVYCGGASRLPLSPCDGCAFTISGRICYRTGTISTRFSQNDSHSGKSGMLRKRLTATGRRQPSSFLFSYRRRRRRVRPDRLSGFPRSGGPSPSEPLQLLRCRRQTTMWTHFLSARDLASFSLLNPHFCQLFPCRRSSFT